MIRLKNPISSTVRKKKESKRLEITSDLILELLGKRHKDRQWVFYPEMVFSTKAKDDLEQADSRIDAWAFNLWPSRNFCRVSYEIKISRHDFLRELKKPDKRDPGLSISNLFYYVLPDGCCDVSEVPEECGLIVVKKPKNKDYYILYTAKKAPWRKIRPELPIDFWASLARRVNRDEGIYEDHYNRRLDQASKKKKKGKGKDEQ